MHNVGRAILISGALVVAGCTPQSDLPPTSTSTLSPTSGTAPVAPPSAPPQATPVVRLAFAGDSYAEGPLQARLADSPRDFVGPFAPILRSADVAMVNLETAVTDADTPDPKVWNFQTGPEILPALAAGGVDVVSMANNHGMDFGYAGLRDSLRAQTESQRPAIIGIGRDEEQAYTPYIAESRGQRIAFFTASQVLDPALESKWTAGPRKPGLASAFQVDTLTRRIRETRPEVDTVVVFLHWGIESTTCPISDQVDLARDLKRAGADVIVGGGEHRIQGGGMMGRAVVNYGLGNFLFQAASSESDRTGVFVVDVKGREIVDYRWHPGRIIDAVPTPLHGAERTSEAAYWDSLRNCSGLAAQ